MKKFQRLKTFSARETVWLQELDGIELAGFRRRAFAFLIDWTIVGLVLTVVLTSGTLAYIAIAKATGHGHNIHVNFGQGDIESKLDSLDKHATPAQEKTISGGLSREALKLFTDIVVPVLYFGIFLWRGNGQTPGKRWMKIRVVSLVHPHISFWHAVERALGYGAAALEAGFGFVQYFIHPYRRCAQDRLAETIVVTERSYQLTFPTPPTAPEEPTAF